jgi:hypothetical protein
MSLMGVFSVVDDETVSRFIRGHAVNIKLSAVVLKTKAVTEVGAGTGAKVKVKMKASSSGRCCG